MIKSDKYTIQRTSGHFKEEKTMTKIRFTLTAAAILAALTLCSCTDQKTEYNYDLIGGELNSDNEYTVDIRKDDKDDTSTTSSSSSSSDISVADDTNTSGEQNSTVPTAPTSEPEAATSTPSNAEVTHPVTSQPEASKVEEQTSEPTSNTATSETSKPSTSEKKDTTSNTTQKYDDNGFPANPAPSELFYNSTNGQWWRYNPIFGWLESDGQDKTNMEDFPSFEVEGGDEQILF